MARQCRRGRVRGKVREAVSLAVAGGVSFGEQDGHFPVALPDASDEFLNLIDFGGMIALPGDEGGPPLLEAMHGKSIVDAALVVAASGRGDILPALIGLKAVHPALPELMARPGLHRAHHFQNEQSGEEIMVRRVRLTAVTPKPPPMRIPKAV